MTTKTLAEALDDYEAKHEFARKISLPVEDRAKFMPLAKWESGYRWFRSPNVICLEKVRWLKRQSDG
jgi:hypothetical protein